MNLSTKNTKPLVGLWRTCIACLVIAIAINACSTSRISETPLAWSFSDTSGVEQIPSGFDFYTLFLNTSHSYANDESDDKLAFLQRNFKLFGDSIGDQNLAVWVNEPGSDALSVSRGKYYADLLSGWSDNSLEYSDGPFIVLSDVHPSEIGNRRSDDQEDTVVIAISLADISTDRTIEVLNYIEARIRRDEVSRIKTKLNVWWVRLSGYWDEVEVRNFMQEVTIALLK